MRTNFVDGCNRRAGSDPAETDWLRAVVGIEAGYLCERYIVVAQVECCFGWLVMGISSLSYFLFVLQITPVWQLAV